MPELASIPVVQELAHFANADPQLITSLRKHYILPADAALEEFLLVHPNLPLLLTQAVPFLCQFFGHISFALRLTSDDHGWETLFVDALWSGSAHDAVGAIDRFEDAWWIENSSLASGYLTFTYRLV